MTNSMDNQEYSNEQPAQFSPEAIDEQVEYLLASASSRQQDANTRIVRDLSDVYQEDEASVQRVWNRLPALASSPVQLAFTPTEAGEPTQPDGVSPLSRQRRTIAQRLGMLSAVAVVILLVSSFVVVLNTIHRTTTQGVTHGSSASSTCVLPKQQSPATVTLKEKAGQSGLYAAVEDGLYRFEIQNNQLTPLWLYSMNWCHFTTPTVVPGTNYLPGSLLPFPRVSSSATIDNGMAYVGVYERSGMYLYALHASNGVLAWRTKIGTDTGFNGPFVLNGLVYVMVGIDNSSDQKIMALNSHTGAVRWSAQYAFNLGNTTIGINAVGNGRLYLLDTNRAFALDASSGHMLWQTPIASDEVFVAAQLFDGVLYATASSGCYNCVVTPDSSSVYAFNATTGTQLWRSRTVSGYLSSPTEAHGLVYVGSQAGAVFALHASDGKQIWNTPVNGEVHNAPQVLNGTVYVDTAPFLDTNLHPNPANGQIFAFDALTGWQHWSYTPPPAQYYIYQPLFVGNGIVYIGLGSTDIAMIDARHGTLIRQYAISTGTLPNAQFNGSPGLTIVP